MELKEIYTVLHIFGAVLGAGGAYVSDAIFLISVKDKVISKVELKFMKLGSRFVWVGLILLIISGLLLFSTNPAVYLASSKFLLKMFVVLVILANGILFHIIHLPRMHRHTGQHYPSSDEFMRKRGILIASGVVSVTSWTIALVLGSLHAISIDLPPALTAYVVFEIVAVALTLTLSKKLM